MALEPKSNNVRVCVNELCVTLSDVITIHSGLQGMMDGRPCHSGHGPRGTPRHNKPAYEGSNGLSHWVTQPPLPCPGGDSAGTYLTRNPCVTQAGLCE